MLYGYFGESAQELLPIRLGALSLGAAIAVTIGWFLLPVRARDVVRARLASALAALSALLEARRTESAVPAAIIAFDAAAESVWASARSHRLHRAVLRLTRTPGDAHPADIGDALREARVSVRAMAAAGAAPRERATAAAVGSLRRALADPAAPLPHLPEPAHQGPLDGVDAALRQAAAAIPALRPPRAAEERQGRSVRADVTKAEGDQAGGRRRDPGDRGQRGHQLGAAGAVAERDPAAGDAVRERGQGRGGSRRQAEAGQVSPGQDLRGGEQPRQSVSEAGHPRPEPLRYPAELGARLAGTGAFLGHDGLHRCLERAPRTRRPDGGTGIGPGHPACPRRHVNQALPVRQVGP